MSSDGQEKIEAYLANVRAKLHGLNRHEAREIIDELRGHILDKAAAEGEITSAGVDSALAALGSPAALAQDYAVEALRARAEGGRTPGHVLEGLFRWAGLSTSGFLVLLSSTAAYLAGGAFALCAFLKPFHPHTAGLWMMPGGPGDTEISLRLGFGSAPEGGREMLGWWIVPLGFMVAWGLVMLARRHTATWDRRHRGSSPLPE